MSNLVHNEQVKVRATFLNNLAVGVLLGAIIIPIVLGAHSRQIGFWEGWVYVLGGAVISWVFAAYARWPLRDLKE